MKKPDCQAGLGRHQHHLDAIAAQYVVPTGDAIEGAQIFIGEALTEKVAAAIDENLEGWRIAEGQIMAPAIGGEDAGLGDLAAMPGDQGYRIRRFRKIARVRSEEH